MTATLTALLTYLYTKINEYSLKAKHCSKSFFTVRVSASEVGGSTEEVRDLLSGQAARESDNDAPPSQFFPVSQTNGITSNLTELR